jgi:polysaccharide biosynthesis protein PslH
MKVLQICNKAPFPANDGSSIAIYNMANGLMANAVNLHLLTINTKKHFKPDSEVPETFKKKCRYQSVYQNTDTSITGAVLNLFSNQSYFVSRFYFPEFEQALIHKLGSESFDIVQLEGLFMGMYIPIIKKYSKAKIVYRAHNVEYLIWERHIANERNLIKKWYLNLQNKRLKRFEYEALSKTDAIISITDADKNLLLKMAPGKTIVNSSTGVNLHEYQLSTNVNLNTNTLFYFGSMDWLPNQEAVEWFLNNCWETIHVKHPNCKFVIAGRNMPDKFKNLNRTDIVVLENVENKTAFYSTYNIMLVPLLSGSGLRIKIIEGLSYGKAIVSTSVGAEGIPVNAGEHLLIADDADAFTKSVTELLENADRKNELEKNAKKFAEENLDNTAVTAKLVAFYKTLLNA